VTVEDTLIGAMFEGHTDMYLEVLEELFFNVPGVGGTQSRQVWADVTYFPDAGRWRRLVGQLGCVLRVVVARQLRQQRLAADQERARSVLAGRARRGRRVGRLTETPGA
jgi:hypothetical protein